MTLLYKELLEVNKKITIQEEVGEEHKWRMHAHTFTSIYQICMIIKY